MLEIQVETSTLKQRLVMAVQFLNLYFPTTCIFGVKRIQNKYKATNVCFEILIQRLLIVVGTVPTVVSRHRSNVGPT